MAQQYTRKEIREKFVGMLNTRPLDRITVKDLASACGINRNTFYYYYSDIYAVLEEIFQMELQKVIDEYNETDSWEKSFLSAAKFALDNRKAVYYVYRSARREELEQYLYNTAGSVMTRFVESRSRGIAATENDKRLIAAFYQGALTELLLHWVASGMKGNPEEIVGRIGELFDGNVEISLRRSAELGGTW